MRNKVFKIILLLGSLLGIALGVAFLFPAKPLPPPKPLPNPNGYTTAISAAETLTDVGDYRAASPEELKPIVAANSNALQEVRAAFSNEWQVPLTSKDAFTNHIDEVSKLKQLAQAFTAEGRLAEIESDPNRAAHDYVDSIELGIRSARGGVIIDEMVSLAVEGLGREPLKKIIPQLDFTTCKELALKLEQLDAQRESWTTIVTNEREWSRRADPGFLHFVRALMQRKMLDPVLKRTGVKFEKHQTELRQLILQLAARAYELDKGAPPKAASDLVPDYLKAVPQDPTTGRELVYP